MSELAHNDLGNERVPDTVSDVTGAEGIHQRATIASPETTDHSASGAELGLIASSPGSVPLAIRRLLDLVVASIAGLLLLVPSIVIGVLIKVSSRGPVLFRQGRVGRSGRQFTVLKFRTMEHGTHQALLADQADFEAYRSNDFKLAPNDPRITSVGRFLRKTSLDELPQLINVVLGHMSVVGIRPLLPEEVALRPAPDQQLYTLLRPGMTGLWQVEGRSTVGDTDRIALDRRYVETWSLGNDLKILCRTPLAVLKMGQTH